MHRSTKLLIATLTLAGATITVWLVHLRHPTGSQRPVVRAPEPPAASSTATPVQKTAAPIVARPPRPNAAATAFAHPSPGSLVTSPPVAPIVAVEPASTAPRAPATAVEPTATTAPSNAPVVLGTEGMITAHASLRAPEYADPDSATNRRVLQAMITKVVARSNGAPLTTK